MRAFGLVGYNKKQNKGTLEETRPDHAIRNCSYYQITARLWHPEEEEEEEEEEEKEEKEQHKEGEMLFVEKYIFLDFLTSGIVIAHTASLLHYLLRNTASKFYSKIYLLEIFFYFLKKLFYFL